MVRLLEMGDLPVERVVIESVRDFTFYATIVVRSEGAPHEIDARPSDALNLAVRLDAPVFIASELIEQSGAPAGQLPLAGSEQPPRLEGEDPELKRGRPMGEWRSVLGEVGGPPAKKD